RVNTHAAPTPPLSLDAPRMTTLPSVDSATEGADFPSAARSEPHGIDLLSSGTQCKRLEVLEPRKDEPRRSQTRSQSPAAVLNSARRRPDCVAGLRRLELRNVVAKYVFESSCRFPGIQSNSGYRDYSRLSCGVGQMQLGLGPASEQAFLRGVWSSSSSLSFCGRNSLGNACGATDCAIVEAAPWLEGQTTHRAPRIPHV